MPRVAYYNTTGDSVRIATITNIGRLAVAAADEPEERSILSNIQKITGPAFDDLLAGDLTWRVPPYDTEGGPYNPRANEVWTSGLYKQLEHWLRPSL